MAIRRRGKNRLALRKLDSRSSLSNEHRGVHGGYTVVDVMFPPFSVFSGQKLPTLEQLCSFVMRYRYPQPEQVAHVVRYSRSWGTVYRLYLVETEEELNAKIIAGEV